MEFGGASFSGLELLSLFKKCGANVKIITGYIHPRIRKEAVRRYGFRVKVFKLLDRYLIIKQGATERATQVAQFILNESKPDDLLLVSQPFLKDGLFYSKAAVEQEYKIGSHSFGHKH